MASGKERGSGVAWKVPETTVSRLQRVFRKLGLDEAQPGLHQASETELQAAFARYLRKAEHHVQLGIASEDFTPLTLPTIAIFEVKNPVNPLDRPTAVIENRSPLMKPYFDAMTMAELMFLMSNNMNYTLDEPPLDENDFFGCRFFFRFVAEAVENGVRVIIMQDEKQTVAVMVHVKAIRRIEGTALLQVEYNCVPKNDRNLMETMRIIRELAKDAPPFLVGTEHQIHFVNQVLQAHERLLDKTVVSKHDEEWYPRHKNIRPSFIVPLSPMSSDSELNTLQELKGDATPASERATCSSDDTQCEQRGAAALHSCVVCDKKSTKLKICSLCKLVKYCSRNCQVSDWPSHKKQCKAAESQKKSQPLPSGASVLVDPKGMEMGNHIQLLLNHRDPISSIRNVKPAILNRMPDHKEGEVYVVKVQSSPQTCLIYDRQRSFTTTTCDPSEQAAIRFVIASVQHRGGAKAYCYARNEGDRFRLYVEDLPEQYVNW